MIENISFKRPGITDNFLIEAGVKHLNKEQAYIATGCNSEGVLIPYYDTEGNPVIEDGKPFGRLRLKKPFGDKKYHQPKGTSCHAYFPKNFKSVKNKPIIIVEGEFKALALNESGFPAIGLPGLFAVIQGEILEELKCYIDKHNPSIIYYLGDSDTAYNKNFIIAVKRLKEIETITSPIKLPRIHMNIEGKGIDDVKENKASNFKDYFETILERSKPYE